MKRLFCMLLFFTLILSSSLTVSAYTTKSSTPAPSSSSDGGGGDGGGGGGDGEPSTATPSPEPEEPEEPTAGSSGHMDGSVGPFGVDIDVSFPFSVYTPKVAYLKSVNAVLANEDKAPVYFMPKLEDFPTDLTSTTSRLIDGNGKEHAYTAVYGGYFDTEVAYVLATEAGVDNAHLRTSKAVYSAEDNSRLLNLIGYDLLLKREAIDISVANGQIEMQYNPTRVGKGQLEAETCIMDLYKAVGVDEWDIEFAYGVDEYWDVEKSPIVQQLPMLTSGEETHGYDISESIIWVAATRTNPDQYWDRCMQDAVFDGGLHNVTAENGTFIGSETSVSFSVGKSSFLTLGQFCAITRAIMTLYGEPVMTPQEEELCLLNYGTIVPQNSYNDEIRDSIIYLTAKGIIDPTEKNFNKYVFFRDIEDILLRVADKGSRLTLPTASSSPLAQQGFTSMDSISVSTNGGTIDLIDTNDLMYEDFLVEITDETQYRMVRSTVGTGIKKLGDTVVYQTSTSVLPEDVASIFQGDGSSAFSIENIALWVGNELKGPADGLWQIAGTEAYYFDKDPAKDTPYMFYHFKVNTDRIQGALSFGDLSEELTNKPGTSFTLPDEGGGIYIKSKGDWEFLTFESQNFDNTYRVKNSDSFKDGFGALKSSNTQMAGFYFTNTVADSAYSLVGADPGYDFRNLYNSNNHTLKTNTRIEINSSLRVIVFEPKNATNNSSNYYRMELYGTNINQALKTSFLSALVNGADATDESDIAFYRAEDNTLLISVNYLIRTQKVLSFEDVGDDVYIMGIRSVIGRQSVDTNVVIYDKNSKGFIMVGDTMFPKNNETLLEMVGTEYYINAKALTGWASDMVLIPTGSSKECLAIDATLYNRNQAGLLVGLDGIYTQSSTAKAATLTSSAQTILGVLDSPNFKENGQRKDFNGKGLLLTSAYSLSNYCMVMANDNGYDYLFVYHIKGQGASGLEDDSAARNRFADLTGFSIDSDPNYYMTMYSLKRGDYDDVFSSQRNLLGVQKGDQTLHYVHSLIRGKSIGEQDITWGWTYSPTITNSLVDAAQEFATGNSMDYALPFAIYYNKLYDINMNVCKPSPTESKLKEVGVLPAYMFGNAQQQLGTLQKDGSVIYTNLPADEIFSDYEIIAAPVGSFALFKASVDSTIKEVNAASLYWGTTKIEYDSRFDKVKISGRQVYLPTDSVVTRVFAGAALNSVYAVKTSNANVTSFISTTTDLFEGFLNRGAGSLVDWDKYTFNRLISNLDSWSSIVLIFCLNILPRVCILLFFVLMLLSLIKDVRPWRAFCNSTFDIYQFLTFGHISVETIDLKRTVWTSMICLSLFYMIMDGALFNFILWLCEFLLAFMQR